MHRTAAALSPRDLPLSRNWPDVCSLIENNHLGRDAMTGALSIDPASLSQKLVIPVRYVAQGEVLQTTSTAIGEEVLHVRSPRPPRPGLFVGCKLYFARAEEVARAGVVPRVTAGEKRGCWTRSAAEDGAKGRGA